MKQCMKGKINAIVTGAGRNKGIGAEICRRFSNEGINVFFTSYNEYDKIIGGILPHEYQLTLDQCNRNGVNAFFTSFDLSNSDNVKELFNEAISKLGNIDILVNCACYHIFDEFESISNRMLDLCFSTNSKIPFLLSQEFYLRHSSSWGSIVNLSSTQNNEALVNEISYAISKASVPNITTTLAPIMAKKRITINSVNPGATDIGDEKDKNINLYLKNNVFGRLGKPKDVANLVYFLVSSEGQWITGQNIDSEGAVFRTLS